METNSNASNGSEPLENRVSENGCESQEDKTDTEMKIDLHSAEDVIDDLDDEESKGWLLLCISSYICQKAVTQWNNYSHPVG